MNSPEVKLYGSQIFGNFENTCFIIIAAEAPDRDFERSKTAKMGKRAF
jgi:hypothetical protein